MPERIDIIGTTGERDVEILSPKALGLLVALHDALAGRRVGRRGDVAGGGGLDAVSQSAASGGSACRVEVCRPWTVRISRLLAW